MLILHLQSGMLNLHEDNRRLNCEDRHHRVRLATSLDEETVEKVNKLVMSIRRS